ncbi:MAG TPA: Hsp20 family protein [Candidatus Acidoferrales bacterium]
MAEKATAVQVAKAPTTAKPVTFENAFDRANAIFEAISQRAYEIFEGSGYVPGHDLDHWFQAEKELLHPVHVELKESEDALSIKAEVPGFNEKELAINVEPRRLVISGRRETKKEEKEGKTVYSETCADQVMRVIELPADVQAEKATATMKDGIVELSLPKVAKARTIPIESKAAA